MAALEEAIANGLDIDPQGSDSDEEVPCDNCAGLFEISVYEDYLKELLPYNRLWLTNSRLTMTSVTLSNKDILNETAETLAYKMEDVRAACPLKICVGRSCGRFIKASRDIVAGEVLLFEPPVVLASRPKSPAHCSTCFKITSDFRCPDCGFYFCGPDCLTSEHKEECFFLRRLGTAENERDENREQELIAKRLSTMPEDIRADAQVLFARAKTARSEQKHREILQKYCMMGALRTLLKISKGDRIKRLVLAMQANIDTESERYRMNQNLITDVIVNQLKATTDSYLVHKICAVWDTNAFQVVLPHNGRVQGLYPFAALFNHDCMTSAQQWFTEKGELVLRAVHDINTGDEIAISYTDQQWCTITRQNHLQKCKQFTCRCGRCYDPTECGTFLGSFLCPKCECPMLSEVPLCPEAEWVCTNAECLQAVEAVQILNLGTMIGELTQKVDPHNVGSVLKLSRVLQKQVHPNHYSLQQLYVPVVNTLVNRDLTELSNEELLRYSDIASQVMRVLRCLQAPMARVTILMGREDLRLNMETLRRKKNAGKDIQEELKNLYSHVHECMEVLDWDSSAMPPSGPVREIYEELLNAS